jgi:hypothetical protein
VRSDSHSPEHSTTVRAEDPKVYMREGRCGEGGQM